MTVTIDHVGVPARDAEASARFLAGILGVDDPVPDGPDGDMYTLRLGDTSSLVYSTTPSVTGHHIAFHVTPTDFDGVVDRLGHAGIPYGNDPDDPENGEISDPFGGSGRVYFRDPDGHFFEVAAGVL